MSDKNSTPGADPSPPSGASAATGDKVSKAAPAAAGDPGLPDLQAHVEAPTWLSGGEEHDAQIWSGAFDIGAGSQGGGDAGKEAAAQSDADTVPADDEGKEAAESGLPAEPEVTNPDDVTLENPVLATPEVGSEAAEAASLDETAAEVKAVEAEAADAAVLTDPAANRPDKDSADKDVPAADETVQVAEPKQADHAEQDAETEQDAKTEQVAATEPASPETRGARAVDHTPAVDHTQGIAAAAPMTGEHPSGGSDLKGKSAAPESTDESPAPEAPGNTAPAPGSRRALRTAETPVVDGNGKGGSKRLLLVIGGIAAVVVLAVVLFLVLGNSEKEPGVLEEDVAPIELETGACLSGFAGVNDPTTVVTCETPHNAQLVATATYPEDDEFPGADALSQRANEVCSSVRYTEAATQNADLGLQVSKAVPTPESWKDGDRRVDCFVVADEGQELTESLIEQ
ncbi:septum formation family protein [Arthrobacter jiangjiafuii]|uniref:Septum formation family protein n=1 Tax=Arthrobacter jiangjiafuii TaxID=2817475 RepID=A0A975M5D7_9MICC|nr:septum formation family protein [Arthrobacter jiangjiafuii]MBP3042513.1 septum formation family protein [Arthrobacter jiangjiafuii]QWC09746.1 septum formation family protein [Arthrobacter jiangjiafuii]